MLKFQIIASAVTTVISPPHVVMRMPMVTKDFVELLCDLPMEGLVPPLAYNLLLILCCSGNV